MSIIEELYREITALQGGRKATGTPTFGPPYSGTGLFSACGFEDAVLTAFVGEGQSIIDDIPWRPTLTSDTRWEVITQVAEHGEAEPTADCQSCPTCNLKTCWLNTCFGRYCRSSEEFSLERVFERAPGTNVRRLMGGITGLPDNLSWGNGQPLDVTDLLAVAAGHCARNLLVNQAYSGNPAANTGAGYEEMAGLALLINTGLVDAFNGAACGALDSDVKAFSGCVGDPAASDIARMLAYLRRQAQYRAQAAGWDATALQDEIRMRYEMWAEVAEAFPLLEYARLGVTSFNEEAMYRRVQEIKDRQALPIDGAWVPVKFDSGIPARQVGNRFIADIYYMNRYYGAEALIYGEFLDFNAAANALRTSALFGAAMQNGRLSVVDGGRFLVVTHDVHGTCIDASIIVRPRILVKAPWLQGRITDVCVRLLQPYPSPDYPMDFGGHKLVTADNLYGPCHVSRQGV